MELLIAVLIAFGVITSGDAEKLSLSELEKIAVEKEISKQDIEEKAKIIGLEEDDM